MVKHLSHGSDRARKTSRALPIALLRARESVMAPIRDMLADINLTEQKWRILRTLDECGEIEQSAIARETCLLLSSLTRILQSMEADRLVARNVDTADRRRTLVSITQEGRQILSNNLKLSREIYTTIEVQLGHQKMELLLDLLEELQAIESLRA